MSNHVLIAAEGIRLAFGGHPVLSDVSVSVGAGEIVSLIGPNGAGKTTLVRVILGLQRPDSGTVVAMPGLRVGYMPQSLAIDETLPLTAARFLRLGGRVEPARLKAALADVGAAHLSGSQMADLSGGELRRVLLARALLRDPHLLVLDEPVQGVDITGQSDLYALIDKVRRRLGCGVLMVSHDLHVVMGATDRVVCLNHHVCCTGHPEAVSRHPEYQALFGPAAAARFAVYTHGHDHRHDDHGEVVPLSASTDKGADKSGDKAELGPDATPEGGRRHG